MLQQRLDAWATEASHDLLGPFDSTALTGADVSWLVEWSGHAIEGGASPLQLQGARLQGAHLERADLRDARLERANLYGAHLGEARLTGAHLEGASLEAADLQGADLAGAHLDGVNFNGARLAGTIAIDVPARRPQPVIRPNQRRVGCLVASVASAITWLVLVTVCLGVISQPEALLLLLGSFLGSLEAPKPFTPSATLPADLATTTLFAADGSSLLALRASDGATVWSHPNVDTVRATHDMVFGVEPTSGGIPARVVALRATDGTVTWQEPIEGVRTTEAATNTTAYVERWTGPDFAALAPDDPRLTRIYALRSSDGSTLWTFDPGGTLQARVLATESAVYVYGGELIGEQPGRGPPGKSLLFALRPSDGALLWQQVSSFEGYGGPVLANGTLYIGATDGTVEAYTAQDGARKWRATLPDEPIIKDLVVDGEDVYLVAGGSVYALNVLDGAMKWRHPLAHGSSGYVTLADGTLYAGVDANELVALRPADGTALWSTAFDPGVSPLELTVIEHGGAVFCNARIRNGNSEDSYIYGLRASDGAAAWRTELPGKGGTSPDLVTSP
jgi:outer membrane protein assembly factor BamB